MKKFLFTVTILLSSFLATQAQLFVGGTVNFASTGGSTKTTPATGGETTVDKDKTSSFTLAPSVGMFFSENLAAGIGLNIATKKTTLANGDINPQTSTFGVTPFVRYYFISSEKWELFSTGGLTYASTKSSTTVGATTTENPAINTIAFNVAPSVGYKLSDKIHFEAALNFLNLNYTSRVSKAEVPMVSTTKDKSNSFNFGVTSGNIFSTGTLTVGAIIIL